MGLSAGYHRHNRKEAQHMRGYFTNAGFYGLVDGQYMLFSGEAEYYEYFSDNGEDAS